MDNKKSKTVNFTKELEGLNKKEVLFQAYKDMYEHLELLDEADMELGSVNENIDADKVEECVKTIICFENLHDGKNSIDIESLYQDGLQYYETLRNDAKKKTHTRKISLKVASVILICVISVASVSKVFGLVELIKSIRWSGEHFYIFTPSASSEEWIDLKGNDYLFESAEEMEAALGIQTTIPSYIPGGYELLYIDVSGNDIMMSVIFSYANEQEEYLFFDITKYAEGISPSLVIEKDDVEPEIYIYNGNRHYLMPNYDKNTAVWVIDNTVYGILGDVSYIEIKKMMDSFYGG